MVFTRVIDSCGGISFIYTPGGLSLLDLTTDDALSVETAQDIVLDNISLTIDSGTASGVVSINDSNIGSEVHTSWANAIIWLNNYMSTLYSNYFTGDEFYRSTGGQLTLRNVNRYATGTITPDYGAFGAAFGDEFN